MESKFTGTLLQLIGVSLLQILICVVTLGIGAPWAICMYERWVAKNTIIDGQLLVFEGTGGELFGKYIVWFLLCIITLGIYSFWLSIKMKQCVVSHTHVQANA